MTFDDKIVFPKAYQLLKNFYIKIVLRNIFNFYYLESINEIKILWHSYEEL